MLREIPELRERVVRRLLAWDSMWNTLALSPSPARTLELSFTSSEVKDPRHLQSDKSNTLEQKAILGGQDG